MIWNQNHPEAGDDLRDLAWQQAAELAAVDPQLAAIHLVHYETAGDIAAAAIAAVELEAARADALCWLGLTIKAARGQ